MLLQRASAGSGKTYKLAKTFIRLFISSLDRDTGCYILCDPRAMKDRHGHILAITFTNKATNEMKGRIVEKLAALAQTHPQPGFEPENYKAPDYLYDFTGEAADATPEDDIIYNETEEPASRSEITQACRSALRVLLNDYGDFNVSTIDTFFQGVLRTMAYELKLNDNYHVELNDEYLAQVGVDETLLSLRNSRSGDKSNYFLEWTRDMIKDRLDQGKAWNIFSKNSRSTSGLYSELLELTRKMSSESFRLAMNDNSEYFSNPERFRRFISEVRKRVNSIADYNKKALDAANKLELALSRKFPDWQDKIDKSAAAIIKYIKGETKSQPTTIRKQPNLFKKKAKISADAELQSLFDIVLATCLEWLDYRDFWTAVNTRLQYLAVLHDISEKINEFRNENNIIPLSETNKILSDMIGNGVDNPFIYERIGTYLHHFLLDEFQDTSRMQWDNLLPLLRESEDSGNDNLIIGDAKQSIYRFRNAEPNIINHEVALSLPGTRILPDSLPAGSPSYRQVNTNWRSFRNVVEFNNALFEALAKDFGDSIPEINSLYSNVRQQVHHARIPGFVRIDFKAENSYQKLGPRIDELRSRGYRLKDIAVLVNKNNEGTLAINALLDYNKANAGKEDFEPIEVISSESLKVNDAMAVKVIVSILGLISSSYTDPAEEISVDEQSKFRPQMKGDELTQKISGYHVNVALNPDSSTYDALHNLNNEPLISSEEINKMLDEMPAVTLPALVEEIAARFLPPEMNKRHCAYISAFQDAVLEYCDNYPTDISSFLAWWNENGDMRTIGTPEGINAVQVLTIHKSKGLEFEVVIIPGAAWSLAPEKSELDIIWVESEHLASRFQGFTKTDIPDKIPVTPSKSMNEPGSPFYHAYKEYYDKCVIDQMNKAYVGFTRAVRELYIDIDKLNNTGASIGTCLHTACSQVAVAIPDAAFLPGESFTLGSPQIFVPEEIHHSEAGEQNRPIVLDGYSPVSHGKRAEPLIKTTTQDDAYLD